MLSAFGRFNERGGGGGCCPLSADLTSGGGGGGVLSAFGRFNELGGGGGGCCPLSADSTIDCIIVSMIQRAPPSRPIQSFNQWAEGAEPLLQWGGGGGGGGAIQSRRGGPCPPCPPPGDTLGLSMLNQMTNGRSIMQKPKTL